MRYRPQGQTYFDYAQTDNRLRRGLIIHWVGMGTGRTIIDRSGKNNHGNMVDGAVWTKGKIGQGLDFDGSSGYVESVVDPNVSSYPFTIAAWVKVRAVGGQLIGLFSSTASTAFKSLGVNVDGVMTILFSNATVSLTNFTTIVDNKWHHVGAIFGRNGSNEHDVYVDGLLDSTHVRSSGININNFALGMARDSTPTSFSNCQIDDARAYNRALSAAEFALLYNQGMPKTVFSPIRRRVGVISSSSLIKTFFDISYANTKTIKGITNANTKTFNGITNV